jgi:predicted O-linked N-acetylglucosamine transferase (SPINDLY family)
MITVRQAMDAAWQHFQRGENQQAEHWCLQVLQVVPDRVDALHMLGVIAAQTGRASQASEYLQAVLRVRPDLAEAHNNLGHVFASQQRPTEALASYQEAIRLEPDFAEAHNNLGVLLWQQKRLAEARASYQEALRIKPDYAEAHHNLGLVLREQGKSNEAINYFRQALNLKPAYPEAHNSLGAALFDQGKLDEASASFQEAVRQKPDFAEAHNSLGAALYAQGKLDRAVAAYRQAIVLKPDFAEAHSNLGIALWRKKDLDEAEASIRRALALRPGDAGAHNSLGIVLFARGELDQAIASHRRALELKPDYVEAIVNLGNVFKDKGELDEAVACYRRGLCIKPDPEHHSNLVYTLNFCAGYDARAIYEENCRWNQVYAEPLAPLILPHCNDPSPERRLRVGYVSPDFFGHVIGRFLLRLLEVHDHSKFEVFCYASVLVGDVVTDRCRSHADVWRNVLGISDEKVAQIIHEDQIDILVDLTMHMAYNRMLVFARKPAPIQVTYLAYCGTTGLRAIDFRFTDPYLDPPEHDDGRYSEQSVRLPETYWCYWPSVQGSQVNALPALQTGHVTFGCLNNFCKVTVPTLEAWRRLLKEVPEARLVLHAKLGSHRDRVRDFFAQEGVAADRVTFLQKMPSSEYLSAYEQTDIALDPFPYGGGTTTCDALWMGVPVVSLAGQTGVGRGGLSILSNIGLADLVAGNVDEYVRIAARLAGDLPRLSELRATIRERMQKSPLMDAPRLAGHIEAAYRDMWRQWCHRTDDDPLRWRRNAPAVLLSSSLAKRSDNEDRT